MIITRNHLPLICSSSLFILIFFNQTSQANARDCSPSSCGTISNISSPFRLRHDPKHCGDPDFELACENNVTIFPYLHPHKYQVKAINYSDHTIRLADPSVTNNTCSFPNHSLYLRDLHIMGTGYTTFYPTMEPRPVNFMSCPYPLKILPRFTEVTHCKTLHSDSGSRYSYVKIGHIKAWQVKHMCSVDVVAMTSWEFRDKKNVSLSEIHESLLYGFELYWNMYYYDKGEGISAGYIAVLVIIILVIVATIVGFPFPAKSIIAVILLGLYFSSFELNNFPDDMLAIFIALGFVAKNIVLYPCVAGILIYKFRRRRLSTFDAIEDYLQGDNKLMPIRYSYSDIKRITRGFQDKLGQGGYGSVYKGKLRSGHYVAVKLLKKPSANGQDFMNEIATIGRIHHVNVITLVGYCAERSKRALVYDFMPNGSLEKYIFRRDQTNSLNWKRKFEIAVGVARGIEYLHRGCDIQILHFDIKPHNILLDDKFIPKVSDFGLAKFFSTEKKTVTLTAARGTIGYVAPELINRGIGGVSFKADVYSFGMLLIEMVGLKKDLRGNNEDSSQYFPCWIYDYFDKGKDIEIEITDEKSDSGDGEENDTSGREIAKKMTIVALWCIQMNPDDRPPMNKVLEMLEGDVERLRMPHRPSHFPEPQLADQSFSTYSSDSVSLLRHDAAQSLEIIVEDL